MVLCTIVPSFLSLPSPASTIDHEDTTSEP